MTETVLSQSLIIFIRNPELGKVKTRLAKDVGDKKALDIYHLLLSHTRTVAEQLDVHRYLFYHEEIKEDFWSRTLFEKTLQASGNLGKKMKGAFQHVLKHHSKAIIIGSDCAQLSSEIVQRAFKALDDYDIVIGPTFDGGYYLLGMKKLHSNLFDDMEWSVSSVYEETINRVKKLNLKVKNLTKLSDIDHGEDWKRYGLK